jgi:uncharacterized protein
MDRVNTIREIVDDLIEKITVEDWKDINIIKHNEITHTYGVASFSRLLALKRGVDQDIALVIAYLHDVGRIILNVMDSTHGEVCAVEAEKILLKTKMFNDEEIKIITDAIRTHTSKSTFGNDYDEIIKDADVLERYLGNPSNFKEAVKKERLKKALSDLGVKVN